MAKRFGVMLDMSRNAVMKPEQVKEFAATIKKLGYNMIQLYTEDTYEIPEEPYFGYLRGRYSQAELKDMVAYCDSIGVELIPCIQTLAHLNQAFRWKPYSEICDIADILLVGEERTYELIENMFRSLRACYTTKYVHVGMDEAHHLGLGKYLDRHGFTNRFDILRQHLTRVIELAKKYDFTPIMWSDMFFRLANKGEYNIKDLSSITDEMINACPEGVELVYWNYTQTEEERYDIMFKAHAKFPGETWFGGGAWTWSGFAPNNRWTLESMIPAMESCHENNVNNIFMTMWGDDGGECSFWSVLPSLYAIRRHYDGVTDMEQIKQEFYKLAGVDFDTMMLLDLPIHLGNPYRRNNSASKYMLYNDVFLGLMDGALPLSGKQDFADMSHRLQEQVEKAGRFGYIFESLSALCKVVSIKYDLGERARTAYKARDLEALKALVEEFRLLIPALEDFAEKFRILWFTENKPHGFDIQENRLGGLLFRLCSQEKRLAGYVNGTIDRIPELEEEILPYCGLFCADANGDIPRLNYWGGSTTVNRI
ncbi:MAG: beta-N-acetylhexosaminidase [Clostridia bacterium]|nr:beta-N-acetylhexosaminidase [Clostridia bacterium]